jgi:hypothetical protein
VSYFAPNGHYSDTTNAFSSSGISSPPLYALQNTASTPNGVFTYSSGVSFPLSSFAASNYWVDAIYNPTPPGPPAAVTGVTYTFTVTATNASGTGPASGPSNTITAGQLPPSAPTGVSASAGNASATVNWTAPANNGSAISGYTITPFIGSTAQTPTTISGNPPATTGTVTGLTNGTTYTFAVSATNASGTGPASAGSNLVTPKSSYSCPCNIFGSTLPSVVDSGDGGAVNLGLQFTADLNGYITGVRFYKASSNTGTHVGALWTAGGTLLGSVTFTNETASGWQQANFPAPVAVVAGTTYVISYLAPNGHYSVTSGALTNGVNNPPLYALRSSSSTPNGLYLYGSSTAFPTLTFNATNYWVDPVFSTTAPQLPPGAPTGVTASAGSGSASVSWTAPSGNGSPITSYTITPYVGSTPQATTTVTGNPPATAATVNGLTNGTTYTFAVSATNANGTGAASAASNAVTVGQLPPGAPTGVTATAGNASASVSWTAPSANGSAITSYTITPYVGSTPQATTTVTGNPPATTATVNGLTNGTAYTFTVTATNANGSGPASTASSSVTPVAGSSTCPCTIFGSATPTAADSNDGSSVEVGLKFTSDTAGYITGVRFYKAASNTGAHVGHLWTATGTLLGTATFTNETASGWQQAGLSSPVAIAANTTYVVSYFAPSGHYSATSGAFASAGLDTPPLHALANATSPNGLYSYGSASGFPTSSFNASNYWVDPIFNQSSPPSAPSGVTATPGGSASVTVNWAAPSNGSSPITSYTVTPYIGSAAQAATTVTGNPPTTTATVTGLTNGTTYTFAVSATNGTGTGAASTPSNLVTPLASPPVCPCTIFGSSTPATVDSGDTNGVEVGLKFTSDTSGFITGVRFYKSGSNTGTHIGNLWTSTGTLLASVTFTNETASGWQQASFTSPVSVTVGTTYVVSYFDPNGHYSATSGAFASAGVDATPLHALANSTTPNGVYAYGTASGFPTATYNAANYWVDPIFHT